MATVRPAAVFLVVALLAGGVSIARAQSSPPPEPAVSASPVAGATPAPDAPAGPLQPCVRATIALIDPVDSAHALPGDAFKFRTVDAATASDGTEIPAGNLGYGVVALSSHAARGGVGGYVALEPRFIALANGKDIPVLADRRTVSTSTATGASNNAPGMLGAVPLVGYALAPYAYLHHGSDVTLPVGTRLSVIVGNELARGDCRFPNPGETPLPPRRQASSPEPSPSP